MLTLAGSREEKYGLTLTRFKGMVFGDGQSPMHSATGSLEEASGQVSYGAPTQLVLSQDFIYENTCVVKVDGCMASPPSLQLLIKNT